MLVRGLPVAFAITLAACSSIPGTSTPPTLTGAGGESGAAGGLVRALGDFKPKPQKTCTHGNPCKIDVEVDKAACLSDPDPAAACTFTFAGTIEVKNGSVDVEWVLPADFQFCPMFGGAPAKDGVFVPAGDKIKPITVLTACQSSFAVKDTGKSGSSDEWIPYVLAFRWKNKATVATIDPWIVNR